jgi:hypothetical protein
MSSETLQLSSAEKHKHVCSSSTSHALLTLPQEIIWTAVREFWLRLVTGFERLENYKGIQEKISNLEQRLTVFEEMCPQLRLEVENEGDRVEQYMVKLDDKTREIET